MKNIKNNVHLLVSSTFFSVCGLLLFSTVAPRAAHARSTLETSYPVEQVWSTAIRFLRVDQGFPILEKDKEAGYILFDYVEDATKVHKASLELVPIVKKDGQLSTKVVLTIPDKPRHVEGLLLEKLQKKAAEELGVPPPPPRPRRDNEKPDFDKHKQEPEPAPKEPPKDPVDPNQPIRGDDGLPRFPQHRELPRPEE